jgi:hypothetical protein
LEEYQSLQSNLPHEVIYTTSSDVITLEALEIEQMALEYYNYYITFGLPTEEQIAAADVTIEEQIVSNETNTDQIIYTAATTTASLPVLKEMGLITHQIN